MYIRYQAPWKGWKHYKQIEIYSHREHSCEFLKNINSMYMFKKEIKNIKDRSAKIWDNAVLLNLCNLKLNIQRNFSNTMLCRVQWTLSSTTLYNNNCLMWHNNIFWNLFIKKVLYSYTSITRHLNLYGNNQMNCLSIDLVPGNLFIRNYVFSTVKHLSS